jgi:hypothetical protein
MNLTFISTSTFLSQLKTLEINENAVHEEIAKNPLKGAVIPQSGGLRKIRVAARGKGKRGGARVIYLFLQSESVIYLLYAYTKGKTENLSSSQIKALRQLAEAVKEEYRSNRG